MRDAVALQTVTTSAGTRANPSGTTTLGAAQVVRASIRPLVVDDLDGETVNRNLRDLVVWIDDQDLSVTPGGDWRCTFTRCGDPTLEGEVGTVTSVERDPSRACRRLTVRLPNDA